MISQKDFSALRLSDFLAESDCERVDGWEYLDQVWICEMSGFTQFCHHRDGSFRLGALSIHFTDLSEGVVASMMRVLGLPIDTATAEQDLTTRFGEPTNVTRTTDDRATFVFVDLQKSGFDVSFTVLNGGGLVYVTMAKNNSV